MINATQRIYVGPASLILSLFFFGCATSHSTGAVSPYYFKPVKPTDNRSYVLMKDSSLVYGQKAVVWEGPLAKNVVRLDGKPIPSPDILGFQSQGYYYARVSDREYAKRYIQGRINVYVSIRYAGSPQTYSVTFFQKGNGPFKESIGFDELKQMLSDCENAYDMINIPYEQYVKTVNKQRDFIQTVIETYNNCGEWK